MKVKVGISNRHVHLKKEDLIILFGNGYELNLARNLTQPGEFASTSKVKIVGPDGEIDNVRVLGPTRNYTQVEISKTDSYVLGINPPVRNSGDIVNSSPITIVGPNGKLELNEGCILANRHLHLTKDDVIRLGLSDLKKVKIKIESEKGGILDNVYLKVADNFELECHLDTDDANSNLLKTGDIVKIIK